MVTELAPRDLLTQTEASGRAARVSETAYELRIDLRARAETYRGDLTLTFRDGGAGDLSLDFRGRTIDVLEINGTRRDPAWNGYRLMLPGEHLGERNVVRVVYENAYDHDGDGFHQFLDPEDGEEYLYSNFEPFEAHRLFPCFDQPDIKATYALTVTAPTDWVVVANGRELQDERERLDDGRTRHRFETTPRFSTYLMALVAGPYVGVHSEHRGLPLGLYTRRSLARHLDPEEIFEVTGQGMDFFSELFDQPYPFSKYDQLFVPEFNPGAMENVATVTIAETYVFRDPPTDSERLTRAEVILHELAHMWFGNLVTMRWWNDLWLNESFATYVSFSALVESTRFRDAWKSFNSSMKRWAYRQDQLVTTHPIAGEVPDTDAVFLNFDGITYGKGAGVLKQLGTAIGRDGFAAGMRTYFRRHAWQNATLADFLAALEEGSGRSLARWSELWLETAGLNTLAASWDAEAGVLRDLVVRQSAPESQPTLRPHALVIALGHERDGGLQITAQPATVDGPETQVPDIGGPRPAFVFPNHEDHAYAKIALDPISLAFVREHVEQVDDGLLRQLLWMSLWEMVRDTTLPSTEFLSIAWSKLVLERDMELVQGVIPRVEYALARYVPEELREQEGQRAFSAAWGALHAAHDPDARILWARTAIDVATAGDLPRVLGMLDGDERIEGFEFDQDMRWSAIVKAIAHAIPGSDDRLAAERERDRSDRGERAAIRAEASRPSIETKTAVWERIRDGGYGSLKPAAAAMRGFRWPHQVDLLEPFVARYFDEIGGVFADRDFAYAREYAETLFPEHRGDPAVLERARALLDDTDDVEPRLRRILLEEIDDLERMIAVRRFAGG